MITHVYGLDEDGGSLNSGRNRKLWMTKQRSSQLEVPKVEWQQANALVLFHKPSLSLSVQLPFAVGESGSIAKMTNTGPVLGLSLVHLFVSCKSSKGVRKIKQHSAFIHLLVFTGCLYCNVNGMFRDNLSPHINMIHCMESQSSSQGDSTFKCAPEKHISQVK